MIGSGRDSSLNRHFIHRSAWLERSITEFLSSACCYLRTQRDRAWGEPLSIDISSFWRVPVHTWMHEFYQSWVNLCVLSLSRCSLRFTSVWLRTSAQTGHKIEKWSFLPITEPLKELLEPRLPIYHDWVDTGINCVFGWMGGLELTC